MDLQNLFKNKIFSALLLAGLFVVAGFLFLNKPKEPVPAERSLDQEVEVEEQADKRSQFKEPENILNELALDSSSFRAELSAVDGSNSKGTAYLLFRDNMTLHAVVAELPEPALGNVYEGWLVQPSPLKFFSTGVMEPQGGGNWILEYARAGDYPNYTRVVITEEESLDEIPEKHTIEGDF